MRDQTALLPPSGPLAGTRVLELCRSVAGPVCGWLLAELGGDVVKLELPPGDPLRATPAFHVLNRSKRSVRIGGPDEVAALARCADVLLVDRDLARSLAPGAASPLGAGALRRANPALVHVSLSGFGERGSLADLPADDGLVGAASGISAMQWSHGGGPIYLTVPLTAYACGMLAALAVAAALHARLASGAGQEVRTSQLAAALLFQSGTYVTGPQSRGSLVGRANDPHGVIPTYAFYRASDEWLFVGALTETFWARLCLACERPDLLEHPELQGSPLGFTAPEERRLLVRSTLEAIFATRPRAEWLARLREHDVPAGPVFDRTTFLRDAATRAAGMHVEVDDPAIGRSEQSGLPLRFARTPGRVRGPAPRLGEHDAEVLREWTSAGSRAARALPPPAATARVPRPRGFSDDPGEARNRARASLPAAPLDGVRVVNLATFIAGALCPMLLADLGAEVVKVEPPGGDPFRVGTAYGFLGWNRGMRSLAVDLRRDEGRELVLRLVERADLVIDNFRAGVLDRLGLDHASLERRNPRIVQLSITGFGPDGPLAAEPCFDPIMQARSGLARAQSGFDPTIYTVAYTDYATATMAALAATAALVARDAAGGGRGQAVWTSLLNAACAMQAGFLVEYPGKPADPPGARDVRGPSAWRRAYATADGWIFLAAAGAGERQALESLLGLHAAGEAPAQDGAPPGDGRTPPSAGEDAWDGPLAAEIASALAPIATQDALARLRAAGVPAVACPRFPEIVDDPHFAANRYWWRSTHPDLGEIVQTGEIVELSATPMRLGPTAPRLGEHSREVLREVGLDESAIDGLIAAGVIREADAVARDPA